MTKINLENKNKTKMINEYAMLLGKIRKEYTIIYRENQNLNIKLQKLEREQIVAHNKKAIKSFSPKRKRYQKYYDNSSSETKNEKISKKKKKKKILRKKKKVYYDNVDDDINDNYLDEIDGQQY